MEAVRFRSACEVQCVESRVAHLRNIQYFDKVKLNILRYIPFYGKLKLLEDCEESSTDLIELSFISDYIEELNEIKISPTASNLPILQALKQTLDPEVVQNNQRLKHFVTSLIFPFNGLASLSTPILGRGSSLFDFAESNAAKLATRVKP